MSGRIVIEVAGEAVGKGRARVTKFGHVYSAPKTVRAEARVGYAAQQAMRGRTPLDGAVKLTVTVDVLVPTSWSKRRRFEALEGRIRPTVRPDADNVAKLVADSLNGIVYGDDRQIADLAVTKVYAAAARMVITIEPISEPSP